MIRSLLNKLNTPKTLRLALFLITLLLLPSVAWAKRYQTPSSNEIVNPLSNSDYRYAWQNSDVKWFINLTSEDVAVSISGQTTLPITLPSGKSVTLAAGRPTSETGYFRNVKLEGLNQSLTATATFGTTTLTRDNETFEPSAPIQWGSSDEIKITLTNNTSSSISCTISSITILTGTPSSTTFSWADQITSSQGFDVSNISISSGDNITLSGICEENTTYSFPLNPSTGSPTITYSSSNTEVAEVNSSSGDVTVKKTGEATITAIPVESDTYYYQPSSYSYTLNITKTYQFYNIKIGGTKVTSVNKDDVLNDGGKVKFTPADNTASPATPATLTLTGVDLTGCIEWNNSEALKIALSGTNKISNTSGAAIIGNENNNTTLTFVKASEGGTCELILSGLGGIVISGFSNNSYVSSGSGLYYLEGSSTTITSALLGGGSGTEDSPFIISTYEHLKDFSTYVNDGIITTEYVKLADDLENNTLNCSGMTDFEPIGNGSNPFKGTFDGNGKTIKTLQYSTTSTTTPVGLFGTINGGTVKNLTLSNCSFSGGSGTGAIVGNFENGTLSNNFYDADVTVTNGTTTKSGQTQRGIGNSDDVIGQVELAGTKTVTVKFISSNGNDSWNAVEGTYYTYTSTSTNYIYYVLPGCNFTFSMKPQNGYKPRFSLSDNAIGVTANEIKEGGAYDHTEFTFTMPNADLEVIWSYPIDLSADNITATIDDANYTGEAIVPTTVKVIGAPGSANFTRQLTKDEHFTIKGYKLNGESVDSPVDAGIYTVTIEGIGEYIGTQDVSYEIIKAYALKINGTQLNAKNIDDFYGNGTVKFTPATETEPTNTLTLNGASVTGTIESGIGNLSIKLIGSNTIQGNGSSLITSLNSGALTFDSDGTTVSSLEFKDASGNVFPNDPISGFAEVKYGWFEYVESEGSKKVCSWDIEIIKNGISYRIYDGNKDHILGEGDESVKYSHDATNGHVITLNNAEVNWIWTNIHADITIALNGTNSAINTGGNYAIYSNNGKINFVKAEGATSVELTATCRNGHVPIEYGSITLGEGLYWKPFYADANATVKSTVITDDPEFIIIEDYVMTDDRSIGTATSGITYNSTDKVLTLNGFQKEYGTGEGQILTGVEGLTIKIVGENNINAAGISILFKALQDNATIKFVGTTADDKLMMTVGSVTNSVFEGFADGAITYENLVYSGGGYGYTIQAPTAPAMTVDTDGKIKLAKGYDDGTIYYSIAYADDTPTETDVEYSDPFALTHPATVTAWVVANGATTSTVTGKYFAYQDAPYKMAIDDSKTPILLPGIAESDPITLSGYASTNGDIATFANGIITAKGPGTATLSVTLSAGDTQFVVLNPVPDSNAPHEYAVTFSVYVGEALGNYFEGSNEYGSFYNETAETYAVPDGMKAYVVTGISGSKLVIEETTVLPPNAVVLLEKGSATTFTKVPATGSAPAGNLLKRATSEVPVTTESSLYVLYQDQYVKVTSGTQIPTGKNYLDLSTTTNAGTRGFYTIGDGEGTTAIREVKSGEVKGEKWASGEWFDLQGRRLPAQPIKSGLYIHKDKKVVIK